MHDAKGKELKEGDLVLIPARVKELQPGDDYCNGTFESLYGRRPDGVKEHFSAINTGVTLRANDGDEIPDDLVADAEAPAASTDAGLDADPE